MVRYFFTAPTIIFRAPNVLGFKRIEKEKGWLGKSVMPELNFPCDTNLWEVMFDMKQMDLIDFW